MPRHAVGGRRAVLLRRPRRVHGRRAARRAVAAPRAAGARPGGVRRDALGAAAALGGAGARLPAVRRGKPAGGDITARGSGGGGDRGAVAVRRGARLRGTRAAPLPPPRDAARPDRGARARGAAGDRRRVRRAAPRPGAQRALAGVAAAGAARDAGRLRRGGGGHGGGAAGRRRSRMAGRGPARADDRAPRRARGGGRHRAVGVGAGGERQRVRRRAWRWRCSTSWPASRRGRWLRRCCCTARAIRWPGWCGRTCEPSGCRAPCWSRSGRAAWGARRCGLGIRVAVAAAARVGDALGASVGGERPVAAGVRVVCLGERGVVPRAHQGDDTTVSEEAMDAALDVALAVVDAVDASLRERTAAR